MAEEKNKCLCCRLVTLNFILIMVCFSYFAFSVDLRRYVNPASLRLFGFCSPTQLTISDGTITIDQAFNIIDTENQSSIDNLDTILGGNPGMVVILEAMNNDRTVIVRSGQGNIFLQGNFSLNNCRDKIMLIKGYDNMWHQLVISNNDN
jgi:hypothetical protein